MIRAASPDDARALAEVHVATWQRAYRDDFPERFLQNLDVDRRTEWFRSQIARGAGLLVAESSDEVAGFCFFGESSDGGWGEVFAIYVHPDHWGQGLGRDLLEAAEEEIRLLGFDRMLLWVLESNERARDFYMRQGWVLGQPIRLEEIGGRQVTEVRYERR